MLYIFLSLTAISNTAIMTTQLSDSELLDLSAKFSEEYSGNQTTDRSVTRQWTEIPEDHQETPEETRNDQNTGTTRKQKTAN